MIRLIILDLYFMIWMNEWIRITTSVKCKQKISSERNYYIFPNLH